MTNRWIVLVSAVVIQTILGGIYAWSAFTPYLIDDYGLNKGQCGLIFGLSFAVFTLAMTVSGRLLIYRGPRLVASIAAVLFFFGYLTASLSGGSFMFLLVGVGVIAGAGLGFGYVGPLAVGMKWFPDKKGLITGVVVAGFGGGAILLSNIAKSFLIAGTDVLVFFGWMGWLFGPLLLVAAWFMADPPKTGDAPARRQDWRALTAPAFWLITLGLFAGTFSGLLIIGNLVLIVTEAGLSEGQAVASISIFAIGNGLGRVIWGHWFDRFGFISLPASLGAFAIFIILLLAPLPAWATLIVSGLIGFGFGACFVLYASAISRCFGVESFPAIYPICFLGYGVAGIFGPGVGGRLADLYGSFTPALNLSLGMLSVACLVLVIRQRDFHKPSQGSAI